MKVTGIHLRRVRIPLKTPYRLSYHTFEAFEPLIVEVRAADGHVGWGEGHVSLDPGGETGEQGWAFAQAVAPGLVGGSVEAALEALEPRVGESPVAATALITAFETLGDHPLLRLDSDFRWPLLTAFNATAEPGISKEVEARLEQGFRTLKIKVGGDADADLEYMAAVQRAVAGRATLRIDANQGFTEDDAIRFAAGLEPQGVELFEQPCAAEDWDANAAVAAASPVPLMLDEPICSIDDIERAAPIAGIGLCKLKLKRFGGLGRLETALTRVGELGMTPVLGDGLSADIGCWMEACVARATIDNAGEFNGYLKPAESLLDNPPGFENGHMTLVSGYRPRVNRDRLEALTFDRASFGE